MKLDMFQNRLELSPEGLLEAGFVENTLGLRAPGDAVCLMRVHEREGEIALVTVGEPTVKMDVQLPPPPENFDPDETLDNGMTEGELRASVRKILYEHTAEEWGVDVCEVDAEHARREAARKRVMASVVEGKARGNSTAGKAPRRRGAAAITRIYPDVDGDGVLETRGVDAGRRTIILDAMHEVAAEAGLDERELTRRERARKFKAATRKRGAATVTRVYPAD